MDEIAQLTEVETEEVPPLIPADLRLDHLNERQLEAVLLTEGPVLLIAGPGTGKTRVLTQRIAYIVNEGYASPHSMLAITFTRKAAQEMRTRLTHILGLEADEPNVLTFHALGLEMVKANLDYFGYIQDGLSVFDAQCSKTLLRRVMKELELSEERYPLEEIHQAIVRAKERLQGPELFEGNSSDPAREALGKIYSLYQGLLLENNAVDLPDLVRLPVRLLEEDAETLTYYQNKYLYLLVDELQDTSAAQYRLLKLLASQNQNLFCVGSPAQAIYSWRNADIRIILERFREDFPLATTLLLERNYRSTGNILSVARTAIARLNYDEQELVPSKPSGDPVRIVTILGEREEARFVAEEITSLAESGSLEYRDCAVLYRVNAQARPLEQAFLAAGIPYVLVGTLRFLRWREVADTLAYLRLIHNPQDGISLERIINRPPRGFGKKSIETLQGDEAGLSMEGITDLYANNALPQKLMEKVAGFFDLLSDLQGASEEMYPGDLVDYVLSRTGYLHWLEKDVLFRERNENLHLLKRLAEPYTQGSPRDALQRFLEEIDLLSEGDLVDWDRERDAVTLSTVHGAKGLEFPVVFLVGLEEGTFPHYRASYRGTLDEERRLFYVGVTRAMEKLYLVHARRREINGELRMRDRSRFLRDLPREALEYRYS